MRAVTLTAAILAAMMAPGALACQSAQSLIEAAEGYRSCEYMDSTGHRTICYGFNLDASGAQSKVEAVGGDFNKVYNGGCLDQDQCTKLLQSEVNAAASSAGWIFGQQCSCIQAVLTDMTYNLGSGGMSSFTTFIGLIKAHNWAGAASDAEGTLWCKQVGSRCSRDAGIIRAGCSGIDAAQSPADFGGEPASCIKEAEKLCGHCGSDKGCWTSCGEAHKSQLEKAGCHAPEMDVSVGGEPASCIKEAKKLCGHCGTNQGCWTSCGEAHKSQLEKAGCHAPEMDVSVGGEPASCIKEAKKLCGHCGYNQGCWTKCAQEHAKELAAAGCHKVSMDASVGGEPSSCIKEAKKLCGHCGSDQGCWVSCAKAHKSKLEKAGCHQADEAVSTAAMSADEQAEPVVQVPAGSSPAAGGNEWTIAVAAVGGVAFVAIVVALAIRARRARDASAVAGGDFAALDDSPSGPLLQGLPDEEAGQGPLLVVA